MKAIFALAAALILSGTAAFGQLAVTDFSASHPIKIMPVGDSITDDCEMQYAWRQYLQQLLDSNSVPFTFVGRQKSVVISGPLGNASFTKTNHEGYCGTVIAPPGVYGPVHNYAQTNAYLERILRDALTNATPDLILILIGANDLGRGRDPHTVAEKDMPALLDMIFSNAPKANVILSKPTNLKNANVSGLNYGAFATNVPIYNAALQALVSERQSQGQGVFLADMFSTVDAKTMFNGDHLHPNATGLKAIAQEWFTRIRTILTATNRVTVSLVHAGDLWTYSDAGIDLGTNWSQPEFDDSGWTTGHGRFGFGELTDETMVRNGGTIYARKEFVAPWNEVFTNLSFRLAQTGGAVVWLNGRELFRTNMPAGPVAFSSAATTNLTGDPANIYYQTNIAGANLLTGTNVLAVEWHQATATNGAMGFDLELMGGALILGPPMIDVSATGTNFVLTWPTNSGAGFALYTTTDVGAGPWTPAAVTLTTNDGVVSAAPGIGSGAAYFRLQRGP